MFWNTGIILVLALSQVPAELVEPKYIENVNGENSLASNRILSGWEAHPGQIPYQTSLRLVNPNGGVSGCGGSVISRDWVITAAHCTAGQVWAVVRAGVVNLTTPVFIIETQEWHIHPTFNVNTPGVVQPNDISVIKLPTPVSYNRVLQPIRIQPSVEAFANYDREVVVASGFGRTWTDSATPEVLNWVYLRGISNQNCQQIFGTALINSNAICATFYNVTSQSVCQGDSGGPLVHVASDGSPILIGIASFVAGGSYGCHSGLPGGFIRPGPFLPWLEQVTGIDFENLDESTTPQPPTTEPTTPEATKPTTTEATTTTTEAATTTTEAATTTTEAATTTTEAATTTTEEASTTTETASTTTELTTTTTELPETTETTTEYVPTTSPPKPTTPEPEESEEDTEEDSSSEEDPEMSELMKKLVVKVKVKVNVNNTLKKKVKVKCVDKV